MRCVILFQIHTDALKKMPTSRTVFFISMAISATMLIIGTALTGVYFSKSADDASGFNWRSFSVYLLASSWFTFFAYGTYIGIVNILTEKELKETTRRLNQCLKSA